MRIAILSDTHGNHASLTQALSLLKATKIECILHCGDIEDAETIAMLRGPGVPVHLVLGNCDTEPVGLTRAAKTSGAVLHGRFADLELAGKRIALIHGDDKRRMLEAIQSGKYDYLFYGHTHVGEQHTLGRTRVVNPGALHRARPRTFVVLDLATDKLEFIEVADPGAR